MGEYWFVFIYNFMRSTIYTLVVVDAAQRIRQVTSYVSTFLHFNPIARVDLRPALGNSDMAYMSSGEKKHEKLRNNDASNDINYREFISALLIVFILFVFLSSPPHAIAPCQ